jgi:hypothetical protein
VKLVFIRDDIKQHVRSLVVELISKNYNVSDVNWLKTVISDQNLIISHTIIGAIQEFFKGIVVEYLANVIYQFECQGLIQGINNKNSREPCLMLLKPVTDAIFVNS